ncbi:MAG: phosphate butyryltransferase [Lachnospiraceae bacterium]|jgi:phosphate butyryltransferase|nr:phosphate butyryltransferase [Lachnospiraceae bacterium]
MITNFKELLDKVRSGKLSKISVAAAQDSDVLSSVSMAYKEGIISGAILVGDKEEIEKIASEKGLDLSPFVIEDIKDKEDACKKAVSLVREGKADLPMKGFVDTPVILKALLDKENGLRTGKLICHVGVLEVAGFDRLFILSDSAMAIAPDLQQKADIIRSAAAVGHALDIELPKVAVLCAVEKVNPKMPATVDADELAKMNERGEIEGCIVAGPLALDNAVSEEAAKHKGILSPVAGKADVLIVPDIEAGNILNKGMEYFAKCEKAGVIMGAAKPLILTSRASSDKSKMHSIALAALVSQEA